MPRIQRVEKLAALFVAVATALSLLLWDGGVTLGVALGGALGTLNFFALRRLVQAIGRGGSQRKQVVLMLALSLKLGLLAILLFLIVRLLPVSPLALLVGISLVVLAIFIEGFRAAAGGAAAQSE
jgi:hypothetical protein